MSEQVENGVCQTCGFDWNAYTKSLDAWSKEFKNTARERERAERAERERDEYKEDAAALAEQVREANGCCNEYERELADARKALVWMWDEVGTPPEWVRAAVRAAREEKK